MTAVLWGAAAALVNLGLTRGLQKIAAGSRWEDWIHGVGSLFRLGIIFAGAQILWRIHKRPTDLVIFIFAAAVLQTSGQIILMSLTSKKKEFL